jgi:hypothetical protein
MNNKHEQIRAAVIKAVLEIQRKHCGDATCQNDHLRPIRLADVLLAISEKQNKDGLRFAAKDISRKELS